MMSPPQFSFPPESYSAVYTGDDNATGANAYHCVIPARTPRPTRHLRNSSAVFIAWCVRKFRNGFRDFRKENHATERKVAVPGKEDERWRKDEGALLFKRWRRAPAPSEPAATQAPAQAAQPSELLKFLAINALELSAPASDALLKSRSSEWFQLSGHPGSLAPAGPGTVWKRRAPGDHPGHNPERDAYEALAACPHMRTAIPLYYRELEYSGERFIELQDLLHGFRDPHVMDIKMGTRTFLEDEVSNARARTDLYEKMVRLDPKAPTEAEHAARAVTKLRYMQFREQRSSSAEQGFRIEAVKLPGQPPLTDLQKVREPQQLAATVARFLGNDDRARTAIAARLREIRDLFERSEYFKTHEIVGSSIFIIYDDERVGAWLIDFAKTRKVPDGTEVNHRSAWQQGNHEEGFLYGLDRLIDTIETAKLSPQSDETVTEPDVSR
ncbi:inositol-trisphosphate 3-kinase homolog isoform X3 [Plodia interpunctella]|uniref:inositol-trisphosphate 3-kinase homolog isoform X3 n=1 Tax=Plodia interpunctella TaxID=58824 RepID=UPI0023681321|nr:inositol-trisphosphate 3-kinase homolog isoform X3 [Plodia interpunctella]